MYCQFVDCWEMYNVHIFSDVTCPSGIHNPRLASASNCCSHPCLWCPTPLSYNSRITKVTFHHPSTLSSSINQIESRKFILRWLAAVGRVSESQSILHTVKFPSFLDRAWLRLKRLQNWMEGEHQARHFPAQLRPRLCPHTRPISLCSVSYPGW